jgi:hypothetical protein
MTERQIIEFCDALNTNFGPPFGGEGFVRATPSENGMGFNLKIGMRDVDFNQDLQVTGAGTAMSGIAVLADTGDRGDDPPTKEWVDQRLAASILQLEKARKP